MWKKPDEIPAHNQSQGLPDRFDPHQWIDTIVVEVETLWLDGDVVVLAGCCESARVARADIIGWRELQGRDGNPSTYQVRVREGADVLAQRAAKASRDQPSCPRCGRSWDGLPAARGPNEHDFEGRGREDRDRGRGGAGRGACRCCDCCQCDCDCCREGGCSDNGGDECGACCGEGCGQGGCGSGECCGPSESPARGGHEHEHGGGEHHEGHHAHGIPHHHHGEGGEHHHHEDHGPHGHNH